MTPRPAPALVVLACAAGLAVAGAASLSGAQPAPNDGETPGERTGGATTVHATGQNAFSFPAANLDDAERTRFAVGNSFFKRNWVEAGASTTARDGLGPHFLARSCGACHTLDGRGAPPQPGANGRHEPPVALLLRLSVPGTGPHGGPLPEPVYGDQFSNAAVAGVPAEGQVQMRWQPLHGRFADGTRYTLQRPVYTLGRLAHGPLHPRVMVSPRLAPQLPGVGLIEAITEADILHNVATQAALPGPIKGQVNHVWDAVARRPMVGRFGWKANVATLAHQTGAAFAGDIGITSQAFPDEGCTAAQAACLDAPRGAPAGQPEIDERTLGDVVFYQATLAPPARRGAASAPVLHGQRLFARAQCDTCHRPSYVTGQGPFPALSSRALQGQRIWPYTDVLLHDMGDDLADGRPDFQAGGRQWKTPPLWGLGLVRQVNGHLRLLHDGRANGVLEAVLWHGGEAQASRQQVLQMTAAERAALVAFVESL